MVREKATCQTGDQKYSWATEVDTLRGREEGHGCDEREGLSELHREGHGGDEREGLSELHHEFRRGGHGCEPREGMSDEHEGMSEPGRKIRAQPGGHHGKHTDEERGA